MSIPENQPFIDALTRKYLTDPEPEANGNGSRTNGHAPDLSDEEIITLCRKAANAAKFASLYDDGDISGYAYDDSRADQALASLLAFYSDDAAQIERLISSSALGRRAKWARRSDYRHRTIEKALSNPSRERYKRSQSKASSPSQSYSDSDGDDGARWPLKLIKLATVTRPPDERPAVIGGMIPQLWPSMIYGDGGTAKSLLVASMLLDVARGAPSWAGHEIKQHGAVIFLDFELDQTELARRCYQLAEGVGLDRLPGNFYYLSGADHPVGEVLTYTLEQAQEKQAVLVALDSLGYALEGDMEASRDVLRFVRTHIKPFERAGIALHIVDHQSKLLGDESYHQKTPFGSIYKSNSCRSVIQVEAQDSRDGELTLRLRHKKANFGGRFDPFDMTVRFYESKIEMLHRALDADEAATEASLNTEQKIRRLLKQEPAYPETLAEKIGVALGTVKNSLTRLRKAGEVEDTGVVNETGARQVRLKPPSSSSHTVYDYDDDDASTAQPGEASGGEGEGF